MIEILPLTTLRFFAAFYVFVFHIHIRYPLTKYKFLHKFLVEGAVGMSLFFILSGFVLYHRYHNFEFNRTQTKNYFIHRFSRIYPIYILLSFILFRWFTIDIDTTSFTTTLLSISRGSFTIFTGIFAMQAWIPQLFDYFSGYWSISVEVFLYTLFPFIVHFLNKSKTLTSLLIVGFIAYIFTIYFGLSLVLFYDEKAQIFFYTFPIFRVPEFIMV